MNFFEHHTIFFIIGMVLIPRITMLIATTVTFGVWSWLGWIFTPYLLSAILATVYYWNTNPVLCVFAWVVAFRGTGAESKVVSKATS